MKYKPNDTAIPIKLSEHIFSNKLQMEQEHPSIHSLGDNH